MPNSEGSSGPQSSKTLQIKHFCLMAFAASVKGATDFLERESKELVEKAKKGELQSLESGVTVSRSYEVIARLSLVLTA